MKNKRNQSKTHKKCVHDSENKLNDSHKCLHESRLVRDGGVKFLDLECHPKDPSQFKPAAFECEVGSGMAQRQENRKDLQKWKENFPSGETFQISDPQEFDPKKLRKTQFPRKNQFKWANMNKRRGFFF